LLWVDFIIDVLAAIVFYALYCVKTGKWFDVFWESETFFLEIKLLSGYELVIFIFIHLLYIFVNLVNICVNITIKCICIHCIFKHSRKSFKLKGEANIHFFQRRSRKFINICFKIFICPIFHTWWYIKENFFKHYLIHAFFIIINTVNI
jgi:hypothetical protein